MLQSAPVSALLLPASSRRVSQASTRSSMASPGPQRSSQAASPGGAAAILGSSCQATSSLSAELGLLLKELPGLVASQAPQDRDRLANMLRSVQGMVCTDSLAAAAAVPPEVFGLAGEQLAASGEALLTARQGGSRGASTSQPAPDVWLSQLLAACDAAKVCGELAAARVDLQPAARLALCRAVELLLGAGRVPLAEFAAGQLPVEVVPALPDISP